MNELRELQKEEKMWKETHEQLSKREEDLTRQIKEHAPKKKAQNEQTQESETTTTSENDDDDDTTQNMQAEVDQAVDHVTLSTVRIQKALDLVSNLVTESDTTRQEIYNTYRKDHQFHGYRGVKDPKGLIRALTMD